MGNQIVKQPNGRYAVFSSIVDHVILYDATPEDIIEFYIERETKHIREDVALTIQFLNQGQTVHGGEARKWDECLEWIETVHGKNDDTLLELKKIKEESQTHG